MRRLLPLLMLLLIAAPARAADLAETYGLIFTDGPDAREAWTPDELARLEKVLAALPDDVAHVAAATRFGWIKVYKGLTARPEPAHRALLPVFHWQMIVDLPEGAVLERRFVHHLLHVYDALHRTSATAGWRALSGWKPREYFGVQLPFLMHEANNQDPRGYGAEDGLYGPEEDFVTFGELYFVTPDTLVEDSVKCRTPDKYRFFGKLFPKYHPYLDQPHIQCKAMGEGFLDDLVFFDPVTRKPMDLGPVDASTVEGFELLYATPGVADAAEIAGHLLLRIKLNNNPQAKRLGIENPNDLVVSFLADTDADRGDAPKRADAKPQEECKSTFLGFAVGGDTKEFDAVRSIVQSLKGLGGGFLTTFDRQTLGQTIKSYTVDQDRNLLRYKLELSERQKVALLDRLYLAKKSYRTKYYFFDRNCASILVQILGEGLGDDEIADFDPFVVPPNTLVALLMRKGLASPVQPAFYGYRKKGHVAQEELKAALARLAKTSDWPTSDEITSKSEYHRRKAYQKLRAIAEKHPELDREIFQLAALGQDAELAYQDKDQRCEAVTSGATERMRELQTLILARDTRASEKYGLDTNRLISARYAEEEGKDARTGSKHTALSSVFVGGGRFDGKTAAVARVALHRQEMGDLSAQSMQRATSVILGEASVATDGNDTLDWRFTGLKLRKFKERLHDVPSFFEPEGTFGLGLKVLEAHGSGDQVDLTLGGGELLLNLASSRLYDDHLYLAIGADLERQGLAFPVRLAGLLTLGGDRAWQLRGETEVRTRVVAGKVERRLALEGSLVHRLAEPRGTELLLKLGGRAERTPSGRTDTYQLGVEWNRW